MVPSASFSRVSGDPPPRLTPRRLRLTAGADLLAGLLLLGSAATPWWYLLSASAGTSSNTEFYPGGSLYAGGGGGGGVVPYATVGLSALGSLYEFVLAVGLLLGLIALTLAGIGFARAAGRPIGSEGRRLVRLGGVAAFVIVAGAAAGVALAQPTLLHLYAPAGTCTAYAGGGPCSWFWGAGRAAGDTDTWGAGLGWWLDIAAAVLLGLAAAFGRAGRRTERETGGRAAS